MKKIVFGLFACIFFLFSCNLEASFGGTDLVIPLPGSEAKIAKYDAGDVASYRVDITRNDGVHYSETGSAGGVIVFENILCGTYTVDIYALDGDTYVAKGQLASFNTNKTVTSSKNAIDKATKIMGMTETALEFDSESEFTSSSRGDATSVNFALKINLNNGN